jgi:hypothetical protein
MLMDILPLALDLLIILVNRGDIMLQQLYQPRGRRLLSGVDAKAAFNRMLTRDSRGFDAGGHEGVVPNLSWMSRPILSMAQYLNI